MLDFSSVWVLISLNACCLFMFLLSSKKNSLTITRILFSHSSHSRAIIFFFLRAAVLQVLVKDGFQSIRTVKNCNTRLLYITLHGWSSTSWIAFNFSYAIFARVNNFQDTNNSPSSPLCATYFFSYHFFLVFVYSLVSCFVWVWWSGPPVGENGTIDGQGDIWWNMWRQRTLQFTRPNLIEFMNSQSIIISNVVFKNSPFWHIHPVYCR